MEGHSSQQNYTNPPGETSASNPTILSPTNAVPPAQAAPVLTPEMMELFLEYQKTTRAPAPVPEPTPGPSRIEPMEQDVIETGSFSWGETVESLNEQLTDNSYTWTSIILTAKCMPTRAHVPVQPFNIYLANNGKGKTKTRRVEYTDLSHLDNSKFKKSPLRKEAVKSYATSAAYSKKYDGKKWYNGLCHGIRKMLNVGCPAVGAQKKKNDEMTSWVFFHPKPGNPHWHLIIRAANKAVQNSHAYKETHAGKLAPCERTCHTIKNIAHTLFYNFMDPEKMYMGTTNKYGLKIAKTIMSEYKNSTKVILAKLKAASEEEITKLPEIRVEDELADMDSDSSAGEDSDSDDSESDSDSECKSNLGNVAYNSFVEYTAEVQEKNISKREEAALNRKFEKFNEIQYLASLLVEFEVRNEKDLYTLINKMEPNHPEYRKMAILAGSPIFHQKKIFAMAQARKEYKIINWDNKKRDLIKADVMWQCLDKQWKKAFTAIVMVAKGLTRTKRGAVRLYGPTDIGKSHCISDALRLLFGNIHFNPVVTGGFPFGDFIERADLALFDDKEFVLDRIEFVDLMKNVLGRVPQKINAKYEKNALSYTMPVVFLTNSKKWDMLNITDQDKHIRALNARLFAKVHLVQNLTIHCQATVEDFTYVFLGVYDHLRNNHHLLFENSQKYKADIWKDEYVPYSLL